MVRLERNMTIVFIFSMVTARQSENELCLKGWSAESCWKNILWNFLIWEEFSVFWNRFHQRKNVKKLKLNYRTRNGETHQSETWRNSPADCYDLDWTTDSVDSEIVQCSEVFVRYVVNIIQWTSGRKNSRNRQRIVLNRQNSWTLNRRGSNPNRIKFPLSWIFLKRCFFVI